MAHKAEIILQYIDINADGKTFTLLLGGNSRTFTYLATLPAGANDSAGNYNSLATLAATLAYHCYGLYTISQAGNTFTITAIPYDNLYNFGTVTYGGGTPFSVVVVTQQDNLSPACDLAISSVTVINESAPGGNGSAQVFATTSYSPVQYSLDNATWQGGSTFNALIGGIYTAYVKDALNCSASRGFTIAAYVPPAPVMGCTNPAATNYNPSATQDDGSCVFPTAPVYDVMQEILIEVQHCLPENPVMLAWKNRLGGFDHWLFGYRQNVGKDTVELGLYELYADELETQQSQQRSLGKMTQPSMIVGAENLTLNQRTALESIADSPLVYRLFQDGTRYEVTVRAGSLPSYDTRDAMHSIELTIDLLRINNLTN